MIVLAITPVVISTQTDTALSDSLAVYNVDVHPMLTVSSSVMVTVDEARVMSTNSFDELRRTEKVSFSSTMTSSRIGTVEHWIRLVALSERDVAGRGVKSTFAVKMMGKKPSDCKMCQVF